MSNTPHPGPDLPESAVSDPSMDDILASIRRILSEEDEQHASDAPHDGDDDVLTLDSSMLLEPDTPAPPPDELPPPQPEPLAPSDVAPSVVVPSVVVPSVVVPSFVAPALPPLPPVEAPIMSQPNSLLSSTVAATATQAMSELVNSLHTERQTAVYRGGPTLEDLVRDEMRPLLATWLDTHLPEMVERVVRNEIERLAGRALA